MIRLLLAAACAVLSIGQARADDVLHFGAQPGWVVPVAAPAAKPADGAITIRVAEFQVRFDDKGMHQFARQIIRVNTPEGLQAAGTIVVGWQPTLNVATVNRVVIRRGAETIDVMKDGKGFQILRRESQLEAATISGILTAVLPIPDLRVGDEVELAYSVDLLNPVLAGHAESMVPLTKMYAADRMNVRFSWPVGRAMRWKAGPALPAVTLTKVDGFQVMTMTKDGWTTLDVPAGAPGRFAYGGLLQAADFADWGTVAGLMRPLYAKAAATTPDSPIMAEVKRIAAMSPDPKVRASEALRVVQSQVRYLARMDGLGGYVPQTADAVWAAKSGDCKGKTVLLLTMLRALGVTAEPALVSATDGDGLDQSLPMPGRFNHVIVKATIDGQAYWLDGTRLGDRGIESIAVPAFKWALPLDTAAPGLTALAATEPSLPQSDDRLDLDAREGIAKPAKASGSVTYRGDFGSQMRVGLSAMTAAQREEMIRKVWTDRYSWIAIKTADYRIDEKTGDVIFSFTGTATMDWSNTGADLNQRYVADNAVLGSNLAPKRDKLPDAAPVAVEARYAVSRETILLPDGGKGFAVEGDAFDRTYGGVRYIRDFSLKDGKFEMSATARSKPSEISYADAKAADKQTDVLIKKMLYITAPATFGAATAEAATATTPVKPGDAAPDTGLGEITRLTVAGKNDEALKLLDARIAGGDKTGKTLAMRGQLLRNLDRTGPANDAYDQALAADRREPLAITGKAEMLVAADRIEDALILYDRLVLLWPDSAEAYRRRAGARYDAGQADGALADLEIYLGKKPDDLWARTTRSALYQQKGRAADALGEALALVKLKPDDAEAQALLGYVYAAQGKRALAAAALDKSIALKPNSGAYFDRLRFDLAPNDKARLADMVALIGLEPGADVPFPAMRRLLADPAARTAIAKAYDDALAEDSENESILMERDVMLALGGDPKAYVARMDAPTVKHPDDADYLNGACWARGTFKVELDVALRQCDKAIAANRQATFLDSRGLVRLQRGEWAAAAADYGDAVARRPYLASSLYGRGVARKRLGDLAGSKADMAAASAIDPTIAGDYALYGITP